MFRTMLRFTDKVVIVTGAGGALGREYALEFAKRGAKVLVNDLGVDVNGTHSSTSMADKVVAEIKALGGRAVANYDSVECGERIVNAAVAEFGTVDVVINNAGIIRDKAFHNMSDTDWELVYKVHLQGAFKVTQAAWPFFRQHKYGRVLFTSSNSAIYGNFGQANYAAAKSGLLGLSHTLAVEGHKYNITSNVIIPTALSRLTTGLVPDELLSGFKAEHLVPLVVFLSHHSCTHTDGVFEAAGGWYGELQTYRSAGKLLCNASAESEVTSNLLHMVNQHELPAESISVQLKSAPVFEHYIIIKCNHNQCIINITNHSTNLQHIRNAVQAQSELTDTIILYVLTDGTTQIAKITLDTNTCPAVLYEGDVRDGVQPDITVTVKDDDLLAIASGKLDLHKALMNGQMKMTGNMLLSRNIHNLMTGLRHKAKL